MSFNLPEYSAPDFSSEKYKACPDVRFSAAERDGILPDGYHSTSMYPEYFKISGKWMLAVNSRMDCCVVFSKEDNCLYVKEPRTVKTGDLIVLGRDELGKDGILVYTEGFKGIDEEHDAFYFRKGRSRETSYAKDYDELAELLEYEKDHGKIVWVMGPAVAFDEKSRTAFRKLENGGYVHGLMAGNALATHDLEGAFLHTALGQDIYTGKSAHLGHYNHLDVINAVRKEGSIKSFLEKNEISDGIVSGCVENGIPFILAGSIRDDGPLPEVIGNVYDAQSSMRNMLRDATTVICMATMLHTIATGNMTPSFTACDDGTVRPVYFYAVDADEFVVNKLVDRGSVSARTIVANVQDFLVRLQNSMLLQQQK